MDAAGHKNSFSPTDTEYFRAMENTDRLIQRVLEAIDSRPNRKDEEWLVAVTTDHGGGNGDFNGEDDGHGELNKYCRTIWLVMQGDGLKEGVEIPPDCETTVTHMDVFPSLMEYLRIPIKDEWDLDGKSRLNWAEPVTKKE